MFFKEISSIVVTLFILTIGAASATEIIITEEFDGYIGATLTNSAPEIISEDIVINTNTGGKDYIKDEVVGYSNTKLMTKTLKLDTYPEIMAFGPLGERQGVLYTGKSSVLTQGISEWNHFSGVMFDLTIPCNTLGMTFSYLNNKSSQTGKVKIIIQEVDESNNVIWESVWGIAGYKSYINGWQDLNLPANRFESRLAGRYFNRVWLIESELYLNTAGGELEGGYFDSVTITATTDIEPVVEEDEPQDDDVVVIPDEPEIDTDLLTDDVIDVIMEDDITVSNEFLGLLTMSENSCPAGKKWKNHGKYVKCVKKLKKKLKYDYSKEALKAMVKVAAKSDIGKKKNKGKGKGKGKGKDKKGKHVHDVNDPKCSWYKKAHKLAKK